MKVKGKGKVQLYSAKPHDAYTALAALSSPTGKALSLSHSPSPLSRSFTCSYTA